MIPPSMIAPMMLAGEDAEGRRGRTVDGVLAALAVTLLR